MFRGFDKSTLIMRYSSINKALGRKISEEKKKQEETNIVEAFSKNADASFIIVHGENQFRMHYIKSGTALRLTCEGDELTSEIKEMVKKFNTVGL